MSSTNFTQAAESLATELADEGIDADADELEAAIREGVNIYSLDMDEAVRTVANKRTPNDAEVSPMAGGSGSQVVVGEVPELHDESDGEEAWVDLEQAQVMGTWTIDAPSVAQKAEIADDTGRVGVTVWDSADAPELSEGDVVALENVPTDLYNGDYSVKVTSASSVNFIDADVDPVDNNHEVSGRVVNANEGLIERCSVEDCGRKLDGDRCEDHGEVAGEYDLRLRLTLDDGMDTFDVTLHRETLEEFFDTTLEEQVAIAQDAVDPDEPGRQMAAEVMGKRVVAEGPELYGSIHADSVGVIVNASEDRVMDSLVSAREAAPGAQ